MIFMNGISFKRGKKLIISDFSCHIPSGKVTMLLGPNGAGKTTLLDIAAGFRSPDEGVVYYNGKNISTITRLSLAQSRAVVGQKSELQFPFSVRDVVLFGRHPHNNGLSSQLDEHIVREALLEVAAEQLLERNYLQLSGGEQQMVQIARALSQLWQDDDNYRGQGLFLDEATANLDLQHQAIVCNLMERLTGKGCTILMIAHDINMALRYGDHFVLMKAGQMHAEGGAEVIQEQKLLEDIFDCSLSMTGLDNHCVVFPAYGKSN
jgi:iron complex transport system ATP-binding protein